MAYGYYRSETVQASQVTGTLTDFPALFSRTENDFRTVGNGGHVQNANGYDLNLFGDTAGAPGSMLDMETELYVAATGQVIKWARVPSIATSTVVWWQYGDSGISTSQDDATGVWDAAYKGVWHLSDGSTLSAVDSTGNASSPSIVNATASASGKIDGAGAFSGSNQYVSLGNVSALAGLTGDITIEAWLNPTDYANFAGIFSKTGGTGSAYPRPFDSWLRQTTGRGNILQGGGSNFFECWETTSVIPTGTLTHLVMTLSAAGTGGHASTGYVNGVSDTMSLITSSGFTPSDDGGDARIATRGDSVTMFKGVIDELRVSATVRSAAWAGANYNNQSAPTSFWGLGSEQTVGGGLSLSLPTIASTATLYAATVAPGPVALSAPFLSATATLAAPTLAPVYALSAPFIASTAALNTPTLAPGQVTLTAPTLASGEQLFAPTLAPVYALTLPTIAPGTTLTAPTVAAEPALTVPTIASATSLFAPTMTSGNDLATPTITSTAQLFAATLAPGAVTLTAPTIASGLQLFEPSLAAVTSLAAPTIAATATLFAPSLEPSYALSAPTIPSGATLHEPSVAPVYTLAPPFIGPSALLFGPTVALAEQALGMAFMASGAALYAPTLASGWLYGRRVALQDVSLASSRMEAPTIGVSTLERPELS